MYLAELDGGVGSVLRVPVAEMHVCVDSYLMAILLWVVPGNSNTQGMSVEKQAALE